MSDTLPTGAPEGWPLGAEDEDRCDLCGEVLVWGQEPSYGCLGRHQSRGEPQSGAPLGWVRHYRCHTACFGRPRSGSEIKADIDASLGKLKEMLAPGGAFDKVREAIAKHEGGEDVSPPPPSTARGPCRMCGEYWFKHPTPSCPDYIPPVMEWRP